MRFKLDGLILPLLTNNNRFIAFGENNQKVQVPKVNAIQKKWNRQNKKNDNVRPHFGIILISFLVNQFVHFAQKRKDYEHQVIPDPEYHIRVVFHFGKVVVDLLAVVACLVVDRVTVDQEAEDEDVHEERDKVVVHHSLGKQGNVEDERDRLVEN